ncbi:hypothetical protein NR798_23910 [Archangium gephyra]|uniref:hypothetical protein n=1 Tax=Archangium gephyra TaxID=48 RepID=UPI0035D47786
MKKLPLLVATGVLSLWGCATNSSSARSDEPPLEELLNPTEVARRDRLGAPTVYNGEATGGAGFTVTTDEGRLWAPEVAPGNTVTRTESDIARSIQKNDTQSKVIDEGPTKDAPQQ